MSPSADLIDPPTDRPSVSILKRLAIRLHIRAFFRAIVHQRIVGIVALMTCMIAPGAAAQSLELLYELSSYLSDQFGRSVSSIGDLDGDEVADVVVGMKYDIPNRVYVFSGSDGEVLDTLVSPSTGVRFGWSVDGVEDIDGDGWSDVMVGAIHEKPDSCPSYWASGRAYAFSGKSGLPIHVIESPNDEEGGQFGWIVRGVGDVDGDGTEDLGVGTPWEDPGSSPKEAGRAYVFSGSTGELIHAFASPSEEFQGFFGCSMAGLGDIDGDERSDLAVGAYGEDADSTLIDAGRVYIFSGSTGQLLYVLSSPSAEWSGYFGWSAARVDDLDGDGMHDLLVGAPWEDPGTSPGLAGKAYVFSPATGELLHQLSSLNEELNGFFGKTVSGMGDIDGDGIGELVVGAPGEDPGGSPENAGRAYVFSGLSGELLCTLTSPNDEEGGYFGSAISGFKTDGGGGPELIVGAPGEWEERGRVYVYGTAVRIHETGSRSPVEFSLRVVEMPIVTFPTRFLLTLPADDELSVFLFDLLGRRAMNLYEGSLPAGNHLMSWDGLLANGMRATSGTYICHVRGRTRVACSRVVIVR